MHRRALPVTFRVVLRRTHVTLGVDAVVISPVSYAAARDADLKRLAMRQRVARHKTTITPTPNPDSRSIDVRLTLQPAHTIFDITQFQLTEILVYGPRRLETFAARRAIVANPDDVTLLRQQLVPHISRRAPNVSYLRRVWSTVCITHHRIFFPRIE